MAKPELVDLIKGAKPKAVYDPAPGKSGLDRGRKLLPGEMERANHQPSWVCQPCGLTYGARVPAVATWHKDTCGVCGARDSVTEPRDFGYLSVAWYKAPSRESPPEPEPEVVHPFSSLDWIP